jgi:TonB family protein
MKSLLRPSALGTLLLAALLSLVPFQSQGQDSGKRRLLAHAAPMYPTLARNMALRGIVKVDAFVAPDGTVKATEIKGGHPILAQAAINAVRGWRWEPAAHESHELIELRFNPE